MDRGYTPMGENSAKIINFYSALLQVYVRVFYFQRQQPPQKSLLHSLIHIFANIPYNYSCTPPINWHISSISQAYLGGISQAYQGLSQAYLRHISSISQANIRHISIMCHISEANLRHISSLFEANLRNISIKSQFYFLGIFQFYLKRIKGVLQAYVRHISSIFQSYLQNI